MASAPIETRSFGPFVKGLQDTWPDGLDGRGVLRRAEGVYLWGDGRLRSLRWPAAYRLGFKSTAAGTPLSHIIAGVNAVSWASDAAMLRWHLMFVSDSASVDAGKMQLVQWSNVMDPWWSYRDAAGVIASSVLTADQNIAGFGAFVPIEDTSLTPPETTMVAVGKVLHVASDYLTGYYATIDTTAGPPFVVTPNPGGVTVRGVFLFQRHLWGFGGTTRRDGGKLWFGTPDYGALSTAASQTFNLPDYNQGLNAVVQVVTVRDAAIICSTRGFYRLTGYGASTWQVQRLAIRLGAAGRRSACSGPDAAYIMDRVGRVWRVTPEDLVPLPRLNALVDPQYDLNKAVLGFDEENQWLVVVVPLSQQSPLRSHAWVYDAQREQWVSGPTTLGVSVCGMSNYALQDGVQILSNFSPGMTKPPTIGAVSSPAAGTARIAYTGVNFGVTPPRFTVEVKRTADGESAWEPWFQIVAAPASPFDITGLTSGVSYDVRLYYEYFTAGRSAYSAVVTVVVA